MGNNNLSISQFYRVGLGMYGGPRGTYGRYLLGSTTTVSDFKKDRERQSGE
jgi:hypothetical protein